jgi:hypothetical protein
MIPQSGFPLAESSLPLEGLRGRDAGYLAPPAQTPVCSFSATFVPQLYSPPRCKAKALGKHPPLPDIREAGHAMRLSTFALLAIPREARLACVDPTVSGTSFLCELPTSVKAFPVYVAFPRAEYSA